MKRRNEHYVGMSKEEAEKNSLSNSLNELMEIEREFLSMDKKKLKEGIERLGEANSSFIEYLYTWATDSEVK